MTALFRKALRQLFRAAGLDVVRANKQRIGVSPFADMQRLLEGERMVTILDVGANEGQSVARFLEAFPSSFVHSFEPGPETCRKLSTRFAGVPGVRIWNRGVGASNSTLKFYESDQSDMSSFLAPAPAGWGTIINTRDVEVCSLDWFAADQRLKFIHILKSDTQGFELEVLRGASQLMTDGRIGIVYLELILSDMYKGQPSFREVIEYLQGMDFALVSFYDPHY